MILVEVVMPDENQMTRHRNASPDQLLLGAVRDAVAGLAHHIRGPIANTAILFEVVEAMRRRPSGSPVDPTLVALVSEARRTGDALGYVERLVDIAALLDGAVKLTQPLAEARRVHIDLKPHRSYCILGDDHLLLDALDAILGQAVAFSEADRTVRVDASVGDTFVEIVVASSKNGRSARLDELPSPVWLAQMIAIRHGGALTVRADAGTIRFALSLPTSLR
jgi:signal transduction histidine kinase